jgi:nicotinamide riboside kinase
MTSLTKWDSKTTRFETARALYESGKSFREIEYQTYLPRSTLQRHAIKEGWQKGCLIPLIQEKVRLMLLINSWSDDDRRYIENEVARQMLIKKRGWSYRYFCNS